MSHEALLVAVQLQPVEELTVTLPVPALLVNNWLVGEMEYVQPEPAWVTVRVWPPTVNVPVREIPDVLAATA